MRFGTSVGSVFFHRSEGTIASLTKTFLDRCPKITRLPASLGCAVALPCGIDEYGMPFGIQVLGPRGGDRKVLEVAKAVEAVVATNMDTKRPVPDLSYMAAQEPMLGRV